MNLHKSWKRKKKDKKKPCEKIKAIDLQQADAHLMYEQLVGEYHDIRISAKEKINRMLQHLNLQSEKTAAFVRRYGNYRNDIAHGRKNIYQDRVVFPVQPVFSFIKDIDENPEAIRWLTANVIANYLGLSIYQSAWEECLEQEYVPLSIVQTFLAQKKYADLDETAFAAGDVDDVTPDAIAFYVKRKKISVGKLEEAVRSWFGSIEVNQLNFYLYLHCAILLSDSANTAVAKTARALIIEGYQQKWLYNLYSNVRDIIKDYGYFRIELVWYGEWLANKNKA